MITDNDRELIKKAIAGEKIPAKVLKDPEIQEGIIDSLKSQGITLRRVNKVLKEQLSAMKPLVVGKGATIEYVPDNANRMDAVKHLHKVMGVVKDTPTIDARQVTFNGDLTVLANVVRDMQELNKDMELDREGEVN